MIVKVAIAAVAAVVAIAGGVIAVSYTHLDVYKRQIQWNSM